MPDVNIVSPHLLVDPCIAPSLSGTIAEMLRRSMYVSYLLRARSATSGCRTNRAVVYRRRVSPSRTSIVVSDGERVMYASGEGDT